MYIGFWQVAIFDSQSLMVYNSYISEKVIDEIEQVLPATSIN